MRRAPDLSGIALDGRYELHALIGEGGFGRVYRARDRRLAREVAVKVIKPWWAEDPDWSRSFEREAQLLASISDPGIVQIFDVGSAPEGLYYVAELVDGESLAQRLGRGALPPLEACEIAEQLARALAQAHARRIVHRDVKPANVLLAPNGAVKLGDFGVARLAQGTSDGGARTVAGTPLYMAPEQARGRQTSPATDVYSIGVVLYEMIAGRAPFAGGTPVELALAHVHDVPAPLPDHTPAALVEVVERALAKDPLERYADGGALSAALARARASLEGADAQDRPAPAGRIAAERGTVALLTAREPETAVMSGQLDAGRIEDEPLAAGPIRRTARGSIPRTRVKPPGPSRRNFKPSERRQGLAVLAVAVAVGLGLVAGAIALTRGHLKVPDLHGMSQAQIIAKARRLGFRASLTHRYSQDPTGTAIDQSPRRGTTVGDGATVTVVLSAGPPPVTVPKLVGGSLSDAEAVLGALRLRPEVTRVPAPGIAPGTVTLEPAAGASMTPGSAVALSVAEVPELRYLTSFGGQQGGQSGALRIRGTRWEIVYDMHYQGMCSLIFFCSGPSATVTNASTGSTVDSFDLGEGSNQTEIVRSGPGTYQVQVSPGEDSAAWDMTVDDYY